MNADRARFSEGLTRFGDRIRDDADRIAIAVERGSLDAPVAACPGWDLRDLVVPTGMVHRWAAHAIEHGAPSPGEREPGADEDLANWMRAGAASLADTLAAADPDGDTWHPFPVERTNWVWGRRQAQETAVHRWDAETAAFGSSTLDADQAAEGLHEFFELVLPRVFVREQVAPPGSSLHVHCTDVAGEWLVWGDGDGYGMVAEHRKGDAALRGPAETLLLVMMGRASVEQADVVGDRAVVDEWLGLPGL